MKQRIVFIGLIGICFLWLFSCVGDSTHITVSEGTNMAVALSPDHSTIAMTLQGALWVLPAKGGDAKRITDGMGDDQEPVWSPDGEYIAFHSYRSGNYHIWVINKDGSGLRQITDGYFDDREPDWSPDGKSIIFSSDRSGNYDIWQVNLESRKLSQLTSDEANDYNPAFSGSGNEIAFVSERSQPGIYILENGDERMVFSSKLRIAAPSWSNDDQKLAFSAYTSRSMLFAPDNTSYMYVADLSTDSIRQISAGDEDIFPFRVNWELDNTIVYTADGKIKRRVIGENAVNSIPFTATFTVNRTPYTQRNYDFDSQQERPVLGIVGPMVSPDGKKVAFSALGHIYIQEVNGELTQLTDGDYVDLYPDWSPDGKKIAYISDRGGKMQIWIQEVKTGECHLLTNQVSEEVTMPSWSPDGKQIAFSTTDYMKRWGRGTLKVADVATGKVRDVISKTLFVPSKASWSSDGNILALMALVPSSTRFREGHNQFLLASIREGTFRYVSPDSTNPLSIRSQNGPVWSPDGTSMAYVKNGVLWVVSVDKAGSIIGEPKQLTEELADNLSWTGDSKNIVYIATDKLKTINVASGQSAEIAVALKWKPKHSIGDYVIHAGKLFNGVDSNYMDDVDIYVSGNRIKKISPHMNHEEKIKIIDASDKVIFPGLFEMHTHLSSSDGEKLGKIWLSYGITSVRETGADPYEANARSESWSGGFRPGPRDFFTGGLNAGNRVYYGFANSVTDTNHLKMELERAKKLNYSLIKAYVRLPNSFQKRFAEGAHDLGIPITSHELYPAVMYNVNDLEHIAGTSRRGYSLILDANFRSYEDVVQLIARSGMNVTPTVNLRSGFYRMAAQYDELLNDARMRKFLTHEHLEVLINRVLKQDSSRTSRSDANFNALLKTVKDISDLGGKITSGTDAPFAPYAASLHTELWLLVQAGLTPFQALQTATIRAAENVGVGKDLGSIEPGKVADLVIVDGDPLHRIQDAMKVEKVIKDGIIYNVGEWTK